MIELPSRSRPNVNADINIVPYIDVMLVLLVIFMMTTPIIEQGVEVDLPQAEASMVEYTKDQPTVITIDRQGDYYINYKFIAVVFGYFFLLAEFINAVIYELPYFTIVRWCLFGVCKLPLQYIAQFRCFL